jgi:hypothetical protein
MQGHARKKTLMLLVSKLGHSQPMSSALVSNDVRCASDSDKMVQRG